MKNVLIAEDEKIIRQGLKNMIQRSGVEVDNIFECNNGEAALKIVAENEIDLMFTDIRMPKMDGITMVKSIRQCEHVPIIVAVSGYDDFNYAVEMLRNGVREYLLKPVERDKITELMHKFDDELKNSNEKAIEAGKKQEEDELKNLRMLLLENDGRKSTELTGCIACILEGSYRAVCHKHDGCEHKKDSTDAVKRRIYLYDIKGYDICIIFDDEDAIAEELSEKNGHAGISSVQTGVEKVCTAADEAGFMYRKSFVSGKSYMYYDEYLKNKKDRVCEELKSDTAEKLLSLFNTGAIEELNKKLRKLFFELKSGSIDEGSFEKCTGEFVEGISKTLNDEEKNAEYPENMWNYSSLDEYEEEIFDYVMNLHAVFEDSLSESRNKLKIKEALAYINDNYGSNLNMAVVSNYVSMNYSLFSFCFKKVTGKNFVNYLRALRMEKAKQLLAETDLKIIEISERVGYDNEKNFMKTFKAEFGISAGEFRRRKEFFK